MKIVDLRHGGEAAALEAAALLHAGFLEGVLGVGRAPAADLEERVRERAGLTLFLGAGDETGGTSLHGADLYPDPLDHLRGIRNLRDHPFGFRRNAGYVLVGVPADAHGPGRPDVLMAERLGEPPPAQLDSPQPHA